MSAKIWKLSACLAVACCLASPALATDGVQVAELGSNVASVQSAASEPLQADMATGAPKRLSKLAGKDDAAWSDAHSLRAVSWHRPLVPLHVSLAQPVKAVPGVKPSPANKLAAATAKMVNR